MRKVAVILTQRAFLEQRIAEWLGKNKDVEIEHVSQSQTVYDVTYTIIYRPEKKE